MTVLKKSRSRRRSGSGGLGYPPMCCGQILWPCVKLGYRNDNDGDSGEPLCTTTGWLDGWLVYQPGELKEGGEVSSERNKINNRDI